MAQRTGNARPRLRCKLGIHRLVDDPVANVEYMDQHGLSVIGWPDGSILMRCECCGKLVWG